MHVLIICQLAYRTEQTNRIVTNLRHFLTCTVSKGWDTPGQTLRSYFQLLSLLDITYHLNNCFHQYCHCNHQIHRIAREQIYNDDWNIETEYQQNIHQQLLVALNIEIKIVTCASKLQRMHALLHCVYQMWCSCPFHRCCHHSHFLHYNDTAIVCIYHQ